MCAVKDVEVKAAVDRRGSRLSTGSAAAAGAVYKDISGYTCSKYECTAHVSSHYISHHIILHCVALPRDINLGQPHLSPIVLTPSTSCNAVLYL